MDSSCDASTFPDSSFFRFAVVLSQSATALRAISDISSRNFAAFLRVSEIEVRARSSWRTICACFSAARALRSAMTYHTSSPAISAIAPTVMPITPSTFPATLPPSSSADSFSAGDVGESFFPPSPSAVSEPAPESEVEGFILKRLRPLMPILCPLGSVPVGMRPVPPGVRP